MHKIVVLNVNPCREDWMAQILMGVSHGGWYHQDMIAYL